MSSGFTDEQRIQIRKRLIDTGTELAGTVGFKKMTIALVARTAGVAVGTFYNFFDSKESFAAEIISESEAKAFSELEKHMKGGRIGFRKFLEIYRENFRPQNNVFLQLRLDDWMWMKTHIKNGAYFENNADMERVRQILPRIDGIRKDADMGVIVNFIKAIYAMYQNRETMFADALETNVDQIFDAIYRYASDEV